jgi:CubicO group peptidase (beta-lactamase class C family)
VYVKGKVVVDLVGVHDRNSFIGRSYAKESIQNIFSSSKAVTSIVVAMLVDRGYISYETPIANVWPEFAQNNKGDITLEDLMRHETGLQKFPFSLTAEELGRDKLKVDKAVSQQIASAKSACTPHKKSRLRQRRKSGTVVTRSYHALTRGWIVNEICMKVDPFGRTVGEFLRDEIASPLGISVSLK